jgi:KaiC/GvpD/RAD55 family RecA-like ATPase
MHRAICSGKVRTIGLLDIYARNTTKNGIRKQGQVHIMDTLKLAKACAQKGWQIFPVKSHDKTPLVKWADVATTDEMTITGWWDTQPGANIGIACGARSGIVVLDVDPAHGGNESLAVLLAEFGELPITPLSHTGGGGRHYIFAHPGFEIRNSAGLLGPGLDIRGDGGYIVAPGSIHPNGNAYKWDTEYLPSKTPLAPMPEWMITKLRNAKPQHEHVSPEGDNPVFIQGGRNQALTSLAGTMRRRGMGEASILAALLAENAAKCFPPLPEDEVRIIAKSVTRYDPSAVPAVTAPVNAPIAATDALLDLSISLDNPISFLQTGISAIDKRLGGLPKKDLIIVAARPSVGKTTLCWQIARNIAADGKKVLFLSLEMSMLQLWRKAAFGIAEIDYASFQNGKVSEAVKENLQQVIIPQLIDRYHYNLFGYDERINLSGIATLIAEHKPELVVIDHLAYVAERHENEVIRLGMITRGLKEIAKKNDCAIIGIHHLSRGIEGREKQEPRMSDLRASGNIEQDADVILMPFRNEAVNDGENKRRYSPTKIRCVKNREGEANFDVLLHYDTLQQWFYCKNELQGGIAL